MNNKVSGRMAVVAGLWLMGVSHAHAQSTELPRLILNVNVGSQAHRHTLTTNDSFTIYAETATVASGLPVNGGVLADVTFGYRVLDTLYAGISVSRVSEENDATVVGLIPNPSVFNRPAGVTVIVPGLDRREVGVHVQVLWMLPVPTFLGDSRLAFTIGPSFFTVRQDLVTTGEVPFGTQDLVPVVASETESSVGVNAGFDLTYPLAEFIGIGGFVRYAGSSFDLESVPDDKAGGFQAAGGIRFFF